MRGCELPMARRSLRGRYTRPANLARRWPSPPADGSESDGWRRGIRGPSISADTRRRGHQPSDSGLWAASAEEEGRPGGWRRSVWTTLAASHGMLRVMPIPPRNTRYCARKRWQPGRHMMNPSARLGRGRGSVGLPRPPRRRTTSGRCSSNAAPCWVPRLIWRSTARRPPVSSAAKEQRPGPPRP